MWQRTRAAWRAQWRTLVVLTLVVGIGGGVALTALAGARRSQTAVPRFVAYNETDQGGFIYGNVFAPPVDPDLPADSLALPAVEQQVVDLPQVAAYFRAPYLFVTNDPNGDARGRINVIGVADAALFRTVDRPIVVRGRLADPDDPRQVVISETTERQGHLQVGSTVKLYAYSAEQVASGSVTAGVTPDSSGPAGPTFDVTVSGIIRMPSDVSAVVPVAEKQDVVYEGQQSMYVTPAFVVQLAKALGTPVSQLPSMNLVGIRLREGADWNAFAAKANAIGGGVINVEAGDVYQTHPAATSAERGTRIVAIALVLFGAVVAVVTLLLVGQALVRVVAAGGDDLAVMRALGATRMQLVGAEVMRAAIVGVGGAVIALIVAVAASPIMPIGLARQAEVHPGVEVNALILVPGALVAALVVVGTATLAALHTTRWSRVAGREDASPARPSRIATLVGRLPLPLSATIGVGERLGTKGRGRRAASTAARLGAAVAVIGFLASVTVGASIDHMARSARDQGWNWDALVGNTNDQVDREQQAGQLLAANPLVSEYSAIAIIAGGDQGTAVIDGHTVNSLIAIDPMRGTVGPPLIRGRPPQGDDEIVLASGTLHELHRDLGDTVHIPTPQGDRALRVVGEMIAPAFGGVLTDGVGDGAWISGTVVHEIQANESPTDNGPPPTAFVLFAVRYAPGVRAADAYASLRRDFGRTVLTWLPSTDALNLKSVDRLPVLLAALVALIGVVTVANTLVGSVRQRRRDLAVLKTVGLERRQIAATVAWHATSLIVVALAIGVPVGLRGGVWIWSLIADGINAPTGAVVPVLEVIAVPVVAIVVALVTAAAPAWSTANLDAADVLRRD